MSQVEVEGSTPKYEGTFDDYLEMFIQFGYVTLFSSAYPLAGLCALLNNLIEVRSDAFKLCFIYQRPFPQRVANIGSWQTAMEVMGVIGVVVNCGLICLLGPVHRIFPNITPVQTLILIIVLEHLMLLAKLLLSAAIPDVPDWVAQEMAKVEHRRRQVEATHRSSSLGSSMETEEKGVQVDGSKEESHNLSRLRDVSSETEEGLSEQEVFLATVSNMKPEEVFNRVLPRSRLESGNFTPVEEYSAKKDNLGPRLTELLLAVPQPPPAAEQQVRQFLRDGGGGVDTSSRAISRTVSLSNRDGGTVVTRALSLSSSGRDASPVDFTRNGGGRAKPNRQMSDTDLLRSCRPVELARSALNITHEEGSAATSPETEDVVFINHVATPELPRSAAATDHVTRQSGPTPAGKRVLDQKEFDRKLKAKRAIFSRGRSISLASFKLPTRLKFEKSPGKTPPKRKFSEEPPLSAGVVGGPPLPVRGEMDLFNIDQLINIQDLQDCQRR